MANKCMQCGSRVDRGEGHECGDNMIGPSSDWVPSKQDVEMQRRIDWERMRSGAAIAARAQHEARECSQDCNQGRDCDCDNGPRPINPRGMFGGLAFSVVAWALILGWLWYVSGRK